jgi:hypothetical protein
MPIRKDLPTFDPDAYAKLTLTDLVVFAIQSLHGQEVNVLAEDVVAACFQMFPKRFSLRAYPHWPDSAMVGRRWSDLRARRYLSGNAGQGFNLTAKGTRRAAKVEKMIGRPIRLRSRERAEPLARDSRYVKAVETSEAFHHFKRQKSKARINEFDFRSLLLCTMESSPATLARNLEHFKENVRANGRKDLVAFLEFCEAKFSHLLVEAAPRVLKR